MVNNINLTVSAAYPSFNATFKTTLKQVDRKSKGTITIEGKHYKILGDNKNNDYIELTRRIKDLSWAKFSSIEEFKKKLEDNSKFTIIEQTPCPVRISKFSENLLTPFPQDATQVIEQALQPMAKDRAQLCTVRKQAQQAFTENLPAAEISHGLCEGIKTLMAQMYDEGVANLRQQGLEPPCQYCVVGLGSLAREEAGPYPDFDNIIVVENKTPQVESYFLKLNQYVADRVYRLGESLEGNKPGLRFCWGNLNPQYQPYEWRYSSTPKYVGRAELLVTPAADDQSSVKFSDIRDGVPFCGSNLSLYNTYKETAFLNSAINQQVRSDMERQANALRPDEFKAPSPITATQLPALIHVKEDLCRLPAGVIGALALCHNVKAPTTIGRIQALKAQGNLEPGLADRLNDTMELLIKWRIQVQSAHGEEFEFVSTSSEALTNFEQGLPQRISSLDAKIAELETEVPRDENAINNAKGMREFTIDCKNLIISNVRAKQASFSDADRAALRDIVLPTLSELYERVTRCLSHDSEEIDPAVFR